MTLKFVAAETAVQTQSGLQSLSDEFP